VSRTLLSDIEWTSEMEVFGFTIESEEYGIEYDKE
jgi:hypothetical protein